MAVKMLCLGRSWWFSLCYVVLCGSSLHGPTSISLLSLNKGYSCVPHWCWVVAPIAWDFIGYKNPKSGLLTGGFRPVTSCYMALPFMDPPQFLCYDYTKAIFVFHIGVGW